MSNIEEQDMNGIQTETTHIDSDDKGHDATMDTAPTSQGEKQKEFHSEIPVKELTEVKLEELFFERQVLLYSDGQLYVRIYNHLETVNRSELEALVYSVLRNEFRRIGKRSKVRAVADLIKLKMPFELVPKNKPCKRNNHQNLANTKTAVKESNAEERLYAGREIIQ